MAYIEITRAGSPLTVPCVTVNGATIIISGHWLKLAEIYDEQLMTQTSVGSPERFIDALRRTRDPRPDMFTFSQQLTCPFPSLPYFHVWDSVAAIPITSYKNWWTNQISSDVRRDIRQSVKRGVEVRSVPFTDDFVRGISGIYDETPVRQGKPFWHYQKPFNAIRLETATFPDRSEFVGAYLGEELVGFLKIIYIGKIASLMHIISKVASQDKRPANALISKAVAICEARGCSYLTYGKYRYNGIDSSLTAFKHRNGFKEFMVPKYYIPLTAKGHAALMLRLQNGLGAWLPRSIRRVLIHARASFYRQMWRRTPRRQT